MFQCIGQRMDRKAGLVRCTNTSEEPTRADKPEWGFLCASCAAEPPRGARPYQEPENVAAMQSDYQELKNVGEAGFMYGVSRNYNGTSEE